MTEARLETLEEDISEDEEVPGAVEEVEEKQSMMSKLADMMEVDEDEWRDQLLMLNDKYGNQWKELGIKHDAELFDEFDTIHRMLLARVKTPVLGLIGRVKKNVSFFGLYKLNDRAETDIFKLENMKKKL